MFIFYQKMNLTDLIEKLIGKWEGHHGKGIYKEEWIRTGDQELSGNAHFIKEGKIVNTEILKLINNINGVFYIADVSHNPKPVSFRLSGSDEMSVVFENAAHDFPQKITYTFTDEDTLTAVIESLNAADKRKFTYELKKIKSQMDKK